MILLKKPMNFIVAMLVLCLAMMMSTATVFSAEVQYRPSLGVITASSNSLVTGDETMEINVAAATVSPILNDNVEFNVIMGSLDAGVLALNPKSVDEVNTWSIQQIAQVKNVPVIDIIIGSNLKYPMMNTNGQAYAMNYKQTGTQIPNGDGFMLSAYLNPQEVKRTGIGKAFALMNTPLNLAKDDAAANMNTLTEEMAPGPIVAFIISKEVLINGTAEYMAVVNISSAISQEVLTNGTAEFMAVVNISSAISQEVWNNGTAPTLILAARISAIDQPQGVWKNGTAPNLLVAKMIKSIETGEGGTGLGTTMVDEELIV